MQNGSYNECYVEELLLNDLLLKAISVPGELGPSEFESFHSDKNRFRFTLSLKLTQLQTCAPYPMFTLSKIGEISSLQLGMSEL